MGENIVKRIGYIDIAKCIAISSVVVGHVLAYDLYGFDSVWINSELMRFICTFHMPLFMFLSGLVSITAIQKNVVLNDFIKRVRMLFVPFLVIGSLYSLWRYGNLDFVQSEMKFGYWYLWVLFVFYVITYPICIGGEIMEISYYFHNMVCSQSLCFNGFDWDKGCCKSSVDGELLPLLFVG